MSDTLTALQNALTPKTGMRRIPLPTESYQHQSLPLSAKRLLNMYAEQEPADARTQVALLPTAGLLPWQTIGTGPIHAMNNEMAGVWYIASGTRFYRMRTSPASSPPSIEDLGDIGAPNIPGRDDFLDMITIAVGVVGVIVCVPPNAFACAHEDPAVNQLGGTFPGGATSVVYLDGYFAFTSVIPEQWFISRLADLSDYDALDFASTDSGGGNVRVMVINRELWFAGTTGFEVWYDAGAADFPFRVRNGASNTHGVAGPRSLVYGDNSLFWLGIDGMVYRSQGYKAVRISTHAIENIIQLLGSGSELTALITTLRGHIFYVINFADRTIAYDCATQQWADRASAPDGTGRWRGNASALVQDGRGVIGDNDSGLLFTIDPRTAENGADVLRQIIFPPIFASSPGNSTNRMFCNRFEVEMEVGGPLSPGDLTLDWSDDGCVTWKGGRTLNAGTVAETRKRVFTTRLGSFRQRVFRLTARGHVTIYAADADFSPGSV